MIIGYTFTVVQRISYADFELSTYLRDKFRDNYRALLWTTRTFETRIAIIRSSKLGLCGCILPVHIRRVILAFVLTKNNDSLVVFRRQVNACGAKRADRKNYKLGGGPVPRIK